MPDAIREHYLESIERICEGGEAAGPHAHVSASERFYGLTAPRSAVIQLSPVHSGICDDPPAEADRLFGRLTGHGVPRDTGRLEAYGLTA